MGASHLSFTNKAVSKYIDRIYIQGIQSKSVVLNLFDSEKSISQVCESEI